MSRSEMELQRTREMQTHADGERRNIEKMRQDPYWPRRASCIEAALASCSIITIKAVLGELLPYSCTGTVLSVIVTVSETDTIW